MNRTASDRPVANRRNRRLLRSTFLLASLSLASPAARGQGAAFTTPLTMTAGSGRPLADVLDRIQHMFLSSVTYEELPFKNASDLSGPAVGHLQSPSAAFSVTLGASDATPYLAAQSVLYAYTNAGFPGVYSVAVRGGAVDVSPVRVPSVSGAMQDVTPVMSTPVTFPVATRGAEDTLRLVASGAARGSGAAVVLLNAPFWPSDTLTVGASAEPARDVISDIGAQIGRPISFQCLWEPSEKRYYLNVTIVAAPEPPGRPAPGGPFILPIPKVPPPGSPWFNKTPR